MKLEEQRIAVAEACGWKYWHDDQETLLLRPDEEWPAYPHWEERGMRRGDGRPTASLIDVSALPDYLNDLNAMHEAVKILTDYQRNTYCDYLVGVSHNDLSRSFGPDGEIEGDSFTVFEATASQRAEAFLRTIGKWIED